MPPYSEVHYRGVGDLALYARDYRERCPAGAPVVLCLHGLTRNSADFEALAEHLAPRYRVVVPDQRGRGRSAYDPDPTRYQPPVYVRDTWRLLDHLGVPRASVVGTSMGGLMAMLMVASRPERVGAVALNDVGPEVDPRGIRRIMSYVGKGQPVADWPGAVEALRKLNGEIFPDYVDEQWRTMARRTFREDEKGVPVLDYDPAIAQPIADDEEAAVPPSLWPVFDLMRATPMLVIRGETSDILSADCLARMQARRPDLRACVVPRRGHAPDLAEPEAVAAIDAFLADFAAAPPPAHGAWWRVALAGGWRASVAALAMRRALRR